MRANSVVMSPPGFDEDLRFGQAVEDLPVQQLVAKRPIEAFIVAVLPRRSRRDVERLHADPGEPRLHGTGDEFAAIIRPDVRRRPPRDEQFSERCQDVLMIELAGDDEQK